MEEEERLPVISLLPFAMEVVRMPLARCSGSLFEKLLKAKHAKTGGLVSVTLTGDEASVCCTSKLAVKLRLSELDGARTEGGLRALQVRGSRPSFESVGLLAGVSSVLSRARLGVAALSSFDADFLILRADGVEAALSALRAAGFPVAEVPREKDLLDTAWASAAAAPIIVQEQQHGFVDLDAPLPLADSLAAEFNGLLELNTIIAEAPQSSVNVPPPARYYNAPQKREAPQAPQATSIAPRAATHLSVFGECANRPLGNAEPPLTIEPPKLKAAMTVAEAFGDLGTFTPPQAAAPMRTNQQAPRSSSSSSSVSSLPLFF